MDSYKIRSAAHASGIRLDAEQSEQLAIYGDLLLAENKKYNLTRISGEEELVYEHFIDSCYGVAIAGRSGAAELLDLGSGAGFPGVPIKIFCPQLKLYLLEASRKKIAFLQLLAQKLALKEVFFLQGRAEEIGRREGREAYAWVTARAVAPLMVLAELALPLVRRGGYFWAFKGPAAGLELKEAEEIIARCGGVLLEEISYRLPPRGRERHILIFEKVEEAEDRFPRRVGIPQKRPLRKL
ncbi:MAG TPA: 16S rRNA (guanine(527)-N(7))-methyltransferase RsmG [Firmicutes bacterium]|nr:16S rRNA (guanine(527)-N(7))-methyltransferase RsmG [Bacillota bacterium]